MFLFSPITSAMQGAHTTEQVEAKIHLGFCVFSTEDVKIREE